ncbi:hypothetical protein GCM10011405_27620 [Rufibacter glacialis]|nr:hypothetical protein GCM10011405_27620 [Rufibacter glacialis]
MAATSLVQMLALPQELAAAMAAVATPETTTAAITTTKDRRKPWHPISLFKVRVSYPHLSFCQQPGQAKQKL